MLDLPKYKCHKIVGAVKIYALKLSVPTEGAETPQ